MSDLMLLRERFVLADRTFTVFAEPWFDGESSEWKGRLLYMPLDRSLPRTVASPAVKRAKRRDDLVRRLMEVSDKEVERAVRTLLSPPRRRGRRAR